MLKKNLLPKKSPQNTPPSTPTVTPKGSPRNSLNLEKEKFLLLNSKLEKLKTKKPKNQPDSLLSICDILNKLKCVEDIFKKSSVNKNMDKTNLLCELVKFEWPQLTVRARESKDSPDFLLLWQEFEDHIRELMLDESYRSVVWPIFCLFLKNSQFREYMKEQINIDEVSKVFTQVKKNIYSELKKNFESKETIQKDTLYKTIIFLFDFEKNDENQNWDKIFDVLTITQDYTFSYFVNDILGRSRIPLGFLFGHMENMFSFVTNKVVLKHGEQLIEDSVIKYGDLINRSKEYPLYLMQEKLKNNTDISNSYVFFIDEVVPKLVFINKKGEEKLLNIDNENEFKNLLLKEEIQKIMLQPFVSLQNSLCKHEKSLNNFWRIVLSNKGCARLIESGDHARDSMLLEIKRTQDEIESLGEKIENLASKEGKRKWIFLLYKYLDKQELKKLIAELSFFMDELNNASSELNKKNIALKVEHKKIDILNLSEVLELGVVCNNLNMLRRIESFIISVKSIFKQLQNADSESDRKNLYDKIEEKKKEILNFAKILDLTPLLKDIKNFNNCNRALMLDEIGFPPILENNVTYLKQVGKEITVIWTENGQKNTINVRDDSTCEKLLNLFKNAKNNIIEKLDENFNEVAFLSGYSLPTTVGKNSFDRVNEEIVKLEKEIELLKTDIKKSSEKKDKYEQYLLNFNNDNVWEKHFIEEEANKSNAMLDLLKENNIYELDILFSNNLISMQAKLFFVINQCQTVYGNDLYCMSEEKWQRIKKNKEENCYTKDYIYFKKSQKLYLGKTEIGDASTFADKLELIMAQKSRARLTRQQFSELIQSIKKIDSIFGNLKNLFFRSNLSVVKSELGLQNSTLSLDESDMFDSSMNVNMTDSEDPYGTSLSSGIVELFNAMKECLQIINILMLNNKQNPKYNLVLFEFASILFKAQQNPGLLSIIKKIPKSSEKHLMLILKEYVYNKNLEIMTLKEVDDEVASVDLTTFGI